MNKTFTLKITNTHSDTVSLLTNKISASSCEALQDAHKRLSSKLWNTGLFVEFAEVK